MVSQSGPAICAEARSENPLQCAYCGITRFAFKNAPPGRREQMDAQNKQEKISLRVFFFEIEPRVWPQVHAPLHAHIHMPHRVCAFQWICHFPLQTHALSRRVLYVELLCFWLESRCESALIEACLQST